MKHRKKSITIVLFFFFLFIFKAYYQRIGAFGCFDDCFNIVAGYFITKGNTLYSEIFFNHQPLMAYISYAIQVITHPNTLYQLILYHRIFIILFSLLMDILIIVRFKSVGVGFVLLYETTKYYLFGDRFLAESLIVYPLIYLVGLSWFRLKKRAIFPIEYLIAAAFSWFVIFMREPFIPVALVLFATIVFNKPFTRLQWGTIITFALLSVATFIVLPFRDFLFNVITVNAQVEVKPETFTPTGLLKVFAYPLNIFIEGENTLFRHILIGISIVFIAGLFLHLKRHSVKVIFFIVAVLGLANIRVVTPSSLYYEAFHITPWYGMFIFATFLLLSDMATIQKRLTKFLTVVLTILFVYSILSPQSFLWEKINKDEEFTTNYANYYVHGEVVKQLSSPGDSLFVDGFDELIHWQADLSSSYKYSWYTSVMPYFSQYVNAREEMFRNSPPDFYYGSCPNDINAQRLMPQNKINDYVQLYFDNKPTCLHINKAKLSQIEKEQWLKANELGFYLPWRFRSQ